MKDTYKSRVYTDRPSYADAESPDKFQAIMGIIATRLQQHPISYKAVDDLEKIRPYEPNVVKAAWNIFGKSYEYRQKYNEYKAKRMEGERKGSRNSGGKGSEEKA